MLILTYVITFFLIVIINTIIAKIYGRKFNIYLILTSIWQVLIFLAIVTNGSLGDYPKIGIESVLVSNLFLIFVGLTIIFLNKKGFKNKEYQKYSEFDKDILYGALLKITNILLVIYVISQILYWIDVNRVIGIINILENPNLLKSAIIEGKINEYSFKYMGRNTPIIGTFLVCLFMMKKRKTHLIFILIYFLISLINVRRDPLLIQLIYLVAPLILMDTHGFKKNLKYFVAIGAIFIIFFAITLSVLTFGTGLNLETLASYTFGSFNSLQYLITNGYNVDSSLPLNNTFYWVYSLLEFITKIPLTPEVILDSVPNGTNVYTGLSVIFIDGKGIMSVLVFLVYQFYIGFLMTISMSLVYRKTSVFSVFFFSATLAASVRFFLIPTFSNTEVIYAIVLGVILQLLYKKYERKESV